MSKNWHKLVFKQLQPMHIGMGNYGVINETRIFIPGWTIWGALKNTYNLKIGGNLSDDNQELFKEISCFWPCFDKKGEKPLLPHFKNGEFYLGNYSEDEFRSKFVDTYVSTAINPLSRMATDDSLHETDVILSGAKKDFVEKKEEHQLYWVGIINIEEDKKNFLQKGLRITVGGDVRYGLGLMELVHIIEFDEGARSNVPLRKANYLPVNEKQDISFPIELTVETKGYEGSHLKISNPMFYILPGHGVENNTYSLKKGFLERTE